MPYFILRIFSGLLMLCIASFSLAATPDWLKIATPEPEFLPMDKAFIRQVDIQAHKVVAQWTIAEGYYLYKEKFHFSVDKNSFYDLGVPIFKSTSQLKHDPNFGDVSIYHQQVIIEIPFSEKINGAKIKDHQPLVLSITYQGCAEAGLCYPPKTVTESLVISQKITPPPSVTTSSTPVASIASPAINNQDANSLAHFLQDASLLSALGIFFLLGIGLSFTPCVLPMIPILSGIIAGQSMQTLKAHKGFFLSMSYVLGMALTFSAAGLAVGVSGKHVVLYLQNAWVLTSFAAVFILLALSMFGFYELQLPEKLRHRLHHHSNKQKQGHYWGVFVMGAVSALVVSPCVSAPLAGVLLYIAEQGNATVGALSLFALALGMGTPLIIIGTTGANMLPKAGPWMNAVKSFFGILLLGVAAWLLRSLLPGSVMMIIWAGLLIIPAIYIGALNNFTAHTHHGWPYFWKGLGVMMLVYGILLIVGAAQGRINPLHPLSSTSDSITATHQTTALPFHKISSMRELDQAMSEARIQHKPIMLDFYADWCIACVEMEKGAFADARVQTALEHFYLIQADLSSNKDAEALLNHFNLLGPPSILFFNPDNQPLNSVSVMGEMSPDIFYQHLQKKVLPLVK